MRFPALKKRTVIIALLPLAAIAVFLLARRTARIEPRPTAEFQSRQIPSSAPTSTPALPQNPLTGEHCANGRRRPIAVMLSGDNIARPLSGVGEADLVIEMPVVTGSITRFMAIFICRDPIEIGSVRSARHDFVPLAKSFDAIYAHWGGSHFALDLLKKHVIEHIDALPNPVGAFYRKDTAAAPHNGFTSMTRLSKAARFLKYRLEGRAPTYPHLAAAPVSQQSTSTPLLKRNGLLSIDYPGEFRVRYEYDAARLAWRRARGGSGERDKNTGQEVWVRNVVVMRATSKQIEGEYNDVEVTGKGNVTVYRGGEEIFGTWHKDPKNLAAKLTFLDTQGQEILFVPGSIWIQIVEPYTDVNWQPPAP